MDFKEVENNLEIALNLLREKDSFLLQNNVSERSIAHKFAQYLTPLFPDYDVDCEYNSNVEADNNKKYIVLLKDRAQELGLLKEEDEIDKELIYRAVFPDIIVHKRGSNEHNLLIIELKKSSSRISCDYDIEKLKRYTSPDYENNLNYSFGVLVYLGVADKLGSDRIEWFKNWYDTNELG